MKTKVKTIDDFIGQIITGDCMDVLPEIPDNSIDLVITSPPYNVGIEYDSWVDNMTWDEYYLWCRKWLKEIFRVMKQDGRFCLNHYLSCGNTERRHAPLMTLNSISEEIGLKHHGLAVWTDITLTKRTAWGSWRSASAPYINCLLPGSKVITLDGIKEIQNMNSSDIVLSHTGNYRCLGGIASKQYKGEIINIYMKHNLVFPISSTPEHRFFVRKRTTGFDIPPKYGRTYYYSDPMWVYAGEILKNQKHSYGRKNEVIYYIGFPKVKNEKIPDFFNYIQLPTNNERFWELVGLFMAEGNLRNMSKKIDKHRHQWELYLTVHIKEKEYLIKLLRDLGFNFRIHMDNKSCRFEISKKNLWNFLCMFFNDEAKNIKGTKSHLKIIPEWVIGLPIIYLDYLVRGYFKGDGNTFKKRKIIGYEIVSTSLNMLLQIQRILLRLNKYATISVACKPKNNIYIKGIKTNTRMRYNLTWYGHSTKWKKIQEDDNYIWFPINKAENVNVENIVVYDLNVIEDNSFCLPLVSSHNSPYEGILVLYKDSWKKLTEGESTIHKDLFMKLCSGVWNMPPDHERLTVATFPVDLPEYCISLLSYKDDIVLDPFSGSGTTCLAAEKLRRRWIGIEISDNYNIIAKNRVKSEKDQLKLFEE